MDIDSMNRLARMEYEQRARSAAAVPEYPPPNIEIQPGWLRLAQRCLTGLSVLSTFRVKQTLPAAPPPHSTESSKRVTAEIRHLEKVHKAQ